MGRGELVVEPKLITYTTPLDDRVRGYYTDLWRRGSVQAAIKDRIDEMIERALNHKQETTNTIETLATAERVRDLIRRYPHVVNRHDSRQSCERPKYYRLLVDAERALNSVVLSGGEFAEEEEEIEEPKPIKLTRNEGRALHILHTERALLDPLGADAGVLERLHDKGAIDDWYEFTDEGRRAYSAFKAEASKS